jgi:Carboxypeptidase regulatory-like domain
MTYLRMRMKKAAAAAAAGTLVIGVASAASLDALPPEQTQGAVTFVTGGIGQDESDAMKQAQAKYPLSLLFAERSKAEYLAKVDVTIKDQQGNTQLQATSEGPYLLAKLPDGKYTVTAQYGGKSEVRQVTVVAAKPQRVEFTW